MNKGIMRSKKIWVSALAAVGAAALVLGSGTMASAAEPQKRAETFKVVQLGDSYSAGNGAGRYWGDPEARLSHNNYAEKYTDWLNTQPNMFVRYTSYAHSGAETNDVLTTQIPQVPADADLVMFTIGGNDVGFQGIVKYCFVLGYRSADDCRQNIDSATEQVPRVERQLATIFDTLSSRMKPGAEIMLVGYPQLSTAAAHELCDYVFVCWGSHSYDASKAVRDLGTSAAAMQRRVVNAWNATNPANPVVYADGVAAAFEGHEPEPDTLKRNPYQWVNGLLSTETRVVGIDGRTDYDASKDTLNWYHPGTVGHAEVAKVIQKDIGLTPGAKRMQARNAALAAPAPTARLSAAVAPEDETGPSAWLLGPFVQKVGTSIDLDARGTIAGDDAIIAYEWDVDGDGTADRTTLGPVASFSFDELYDGQVTVRAVQGNGKSSTASTHVLITDDGDSTPAELDNCPGVENYSQSDEDGDGIGDACDDTAGHPEADLPGVRVIDSEGRVTRVGDDPADPAEVPENSDGASLVAATTTTTAGAVVEYRVEGFRAGDEVELLWDTDEQVVLTTSTVAADGSSTGRIAVPADAAPGTYDLIAVAPATLASVELSVTAAAAGSTPAPTESAKPLPAALAATGVDTGYVPTWVAGGSVAVLVGAALLLVALRRRSERSSRV